MQKKTLAMRMLDQQNIPYRILEYTYDPENLSVAKRLPRKNGLDVSDVYKTLVAKGNRSGLMVALIPGDKLLHNKALAKASNNKKVGMVEMAKLEEYTGYIRGGCCPLGMKTPLPTYLDASAELKENVWVNAGARGILIELQVTDLIELTDAEVLAISEAVE